MYTTCHLGAAADPLALGFAGSRLLQLVTREGMKSHLVEVPGSALLPGHFMRAEVQARVAAAFADVMAAMSTWAWQAGC